jgi:hypothetical protein
MESVPAAQDNVAMDTITTVVAILAGLVILLVGIFALASIFFDDLP